MGRKLAGMGVRSCGDLQQVSLSQLQKKFGPRTGQTLFRFCRGLDERPVRYEKERKSVSAEMNYNIRFTKVRPTSLCHVSVIISVVLYLCILKEKKDMSKCTGGLLYMLAINLEKIISKIFPEINTKIQFLVIYY